MRGVQSPLCDAGLEPHQLRRTFAQREPPWTLHRLLVSDVRPSRCESDQLVPSWLTADVAVQMNNLQSMGDRQVSFNRSCSQSPVVGDHDPAAVSHDRYPVGVEYPSRQQFLNRCPAESRSVAAHCNHRVAETEQVLVDDIPNITDRCRHPLLRYLGRRESVLVGVVERLLNVMQAQPVICSEIFGRHTAPCHSGNGDW